MKNTSLYAGVNRAVIGLIKSIKSERNLKLEVAMAVLALIVSLFFKLSTFELLLLVFTIVLVLVTELINTAIELTLDSIFGGRQNALVRKAKDVAAGAVLVTSLNAMFVAYVLFYSKVAHSGLSVFSKLKKTPTYVTLICVALILIVTLVIKSFTSHNKALRGGMPSGHSSIAFGIATSIGFLAEGMNHSVLLITLSYVLAMLVAQSRVEGKIHTTLEVVSGSLIGIFTSILIFSIFT